MRRNNARARTGFGAARDESLGAEAPAELLPAAAEDGSLGAEPPAETLSAELPLVADAPSELISGAAAVDRVVSASRAI